jgi:Uma2 family endonuclease
MALVPEEAKTCYTYRDYLEWDEDERGEILDGQVYMLASPDLYHQEISGNLYFQIKTFLKGKPCQPYYAPVTVRLFPEEDNGDSTVFEPDLIVVCDPSKLDKKSCRGAPDLVVEILSPSTASRDKVLKFRKYQQAGVREYWIISPDDKTIQACVLTDGGHYIVTGYGEEDNAPITALPGCVIDLKEVFSARPAPVIPHHSLSSS